MNKQMLYYAAAMGDALGVPHEFKTWYGVSAHFIDSPLMIPNKYRSHKWAEFGVTSDDFSQILCVRECLLNPDLDFDQEMLLWRDGKYWVNQNNFDIGMQTFSALEHFSKEGHYLIDDYASGNGGLMRMLPLAVESLHGESIRDAVSRYSLITHNSDESLAVSELYVRLLRNMIQGLDFPTAWDVAVAETDYEFHDWGFNGDASGWSMDTMRLVKAIAGRSVGFVDGIKQCLRFGQDADTNACVLAPVLALMHGMDDVPPDWHEFMKPNQQNPWYCEATGQ